MLASYPASSVIGTLAVELGDTDSAAARDTSSSSVVLTKIDRGSSSEFVLNVEESN